MQSRGTGRREARSPQRGERHLLPQRVYEHVRAMILRGELQPGSKIVEDQLGRDLEVSRTPVREAVRLLESEGYVTVIPHRGAVVASMSRTDVEDVYAVVGVLEGLAVALATPVMTADDLAAMTASHRRLVAAASRGDINAYFELNREFHGIVLGRCPNALVLQHSNRFWDRVNRYRLLSLSPPGRLARSVREHAALLHAVRARNAAAARRRYEQHVANGAKALVGMLAALAGSTLDVAGPAR